MRWITRPGWPGNLLAMVAGASTLLALAPFDIWPLALLSIALFYAGLRAQPAPGPGRGWCFGFGLYGAGTWWIYVSMNTYGGASPLLAILLLLAFFACLAWFFALPAWLWARWLRRNEAPGRRAGLRCAVAAAGSLPRLVPDRFPVALRRLQPARRPLGRLAPLGGVVFRSGPDRGAAVQPPACARAHRSWPSAPCAGGALGRRHGAQGHAWTSRPATRSRSPRFRATSNKT
jgi:apolipoprotein N-acyltransferase